jgi:hypothetical protein
MIALTKEQYLELCTSFTDCSWIKDGTSCVGKKCIDCHLEYAREKGWIMEPEKECKDCLYYRAKSGYHPCYKCGDHREFKPKEPIKDQVSEEWARGFFEDSGEPKGYIQNHIEKLKKNNRIKESKLDELNKYVDSIGNINRYTKTMTENGCDNRFILKNLISAAIKEIQEANNKEK